jgi:hypothetical protein
MSFLKNLFGSKGAEPVKISDEQQRLLDQAQSTVRNYLQNGKMFPLFAMALQNDGEIGSFLQSEEFSSERDAFVGILQALIPLARQGAISAAVLVTPMAPPEGFDEASAMFDLEQRGKARFAAMLPYRRSEAGVEFGTVVFRKMEPKLFAS